MRRALVATAAAAVLAPALGATTAGAGSSPRSRDPKPQRMLVISLPALAWKDVNDHQLPNLNRLLDESAVADLTTRTISRETKLADGYITLGAGTRSIGTGKDVDGEGFEVGEPFGTDNAGQVALHFAALAALGFIPALLLARLVPFHKTGDLAYWSALAVASLALAGLYRAVGRWRRDELLPLMLALGLIVAVLVVDVLIGAPLQFNNPIGYSPKVAGRFSGYGNLGYAALASAAVLLSALLAHWLGGRRGAVTAIGLLGVVFVVDGTPFWGSDVGGVLSMLPAFAVAAYLLLGLRIRFRTLVLSAVAAVAALMVFGLIDLSRPRDQRTHLGRLFETTGSRGLSSLGTVIERKASENLSVLFRSAWLLMVVLVLAFLVYLYMRRGERLRAIVERVPELRAGFIGLAIVAALGFALNDSGIAVPGMMVGVLNATIVVLLLVSAKRGSAASATAPATAGRAEPAAIPG